MIKILKYGLASLCLLSLISCNRIKNKTEQIADKAKSKAKKEIVKQTDRVIDKVFPPFDHDKPDTENNKKRFADFLQIEITPDINEIYCFDDAIGIDADYMFSFNCNSETSKKIIKTHGLTLDKTNSDNGFNLQHDFDWWNKDRIAQLDKYSWTNGQGYHKYYWYDLENKKAYFFDFDL
jgi:hypothetical protein